MQGLCWRGEGGGGGGGDSVVDVGFSMGIICADNARHATLTCKTTPTFFCSTQTATVSLRTMFGCGKTVGKSATTGTSSVYPAMMMSFFVAWLSSTLEVYAGY